MPKKGKILHFLSLLHSVTVTSCNIYRIDVSSWILTLNLHQLRRFCTSANFNLCHCPVPWECPRTARGSGSCPSCEISSVHSSSGTPQANPCSCWSMLKLIVFAHFVILIPLLSNSRRYLLVTQTKQYFKKTVWQRVANLFISYCGYYLHLYHLSPTYCTFPSSLEMA